MGHCSPVLSPVLPKGQPDEHLPFRFISEDIEDGYLSLKVKRNVFGIIERAVDQEWKITELNSELLDFCVISSRSLCLSGSNAQKIFPFIHIYFNRLWLSGWLIDFFKHWIQSWDWDKNIIHSSIQYFVLLPGTRSCPGHCLRLNESPHSLFQREFEADCKNNSVQFKKNKAKPGII